jgi:predicted DsbA family dithiol-disulfide isomerase
VQKTLKIDVWTDVVCPWCLVGSERLDQAVARLPADVAIDIENHPFYLDPNTPPEGYDVGEMLRSKYGRDPREMQARVESEAKKAGIDLDLSLQPRSFPTKKAHTLTRLSRDRGTQHALANAIAAAYFLEHRLINEDDVLAEIAAQNGFSRDEALAVIRDPKALAETEALAQAAARGGIHGVPFFVLQGKYALSGAQPQDVFDMALEQVLGETAAPAA